MHLQQDMLGFAVLALIAVGLVGLVHLKGFTFGLRNSRRQVEIAAAAMVIVASILMVLALEVQNSRFQFLTAVDCANPSADPNNCIGQTEATVASVRLWNTQHSNFWFVKFTTKLPPTEFAPDSLTGSGLGTGQTVQAHVWQGKGGVHLLSRLDGRVTGGW
jgi:hypothetical protein